MKPSEVLTTKWMESSPKYCELKYGCSRIAVYDSNAAHEAGAILYGFEPKPDSATAARSKCPGVSTHGKRYV